MRSNTIALLLTLLCSAATADVSDVTETGFVSTHELTFAHSPAEVYQALTAEVAGWWDASHSWSGKAANFSMDARAQGCFCEDLDNGGSVQHMRVLFASPGKLLRLEGGLGPLQGMGANGVMDFSLLDEDGGTRLKYRYIVYGHASLKLDTLATVVDQVQLGQLKRLHAYVENR